MSIAIVDVVCFEANRLAMHCAVGAPAGCLLLIGLTQVQSHHHHLALPPLALTRHVASVLGSLGPWILGSEFLLLR